MSTDLIPFTYEDFQVRTVLVDGEPWFVASDVCSVLGYSRVADALRMLDDDDLGTHSVRGSDGLERPSQIVSESGLYSLILRSKRPEAKAFKRWITHEVLPAIRKTGRYEPALPLRRSGSPSRACSTYTSTSEAPLSFGLTLAVLHERRDEDRVDRGNPRGDPVMGSAAGVRKVAAARIGITLAEYDMRTAAGQKWCTYCRRWHPRRAFGRDSSRADGLSARCAVSQIRSIETPGKAERRVARGRGEDWCRDCRAWLPAAEVRSGVCREHANLAGRGYYAARSHEVAQRKAARRRDLEPVPEWWRLETFEAFGGGLCAYGCIRSATTLDHIWPYARGGQSQPGNLVPACKPCNSAKRDRDPTPWVERGSIAFPDQWLDIAALALEVGCDYWMEAA